MFDSVHELLKMFEERFPGKWGRRFTTLLVIVVMIAVFMLCTRYTATTIVSGWRHIVGSRAQAQPVKAIPDVPVASFTGQSGGQSNSITNHDPVYNRAQYPLAPNATSARRQPPAQPKVIYVERSGMRIPLFVPGIMYDPERKAAPPSSNVPITRGGAGASSNPVAAVVMRGNVKGTRFYDSPIGETVTLEDANGMAPDDSEFVRSPITPPHQK